jgi:hypothetical protein
MEQSTGNNHPNFDDLRLFCAQHDLPKPGRAVGGAIRAIYLDGKNPVSVIRGNDIGETGRFLTRLAQDHSDPQQPELTSES